jgi:hypothetical protein
MNNCNINSFNFSSVPKIGDVIWQELEGEAVLLNPKTGEYFGLNDVGCSFWKKVDGRLSFEEIINELLKEYDVNKDELERDLAELIGKMVHYRLVSIE